METGPGGEGLRHLREIAVSADAGRLDAELLERFVASNDAAAFARLVERHGPVVLGVCRRVLRNHHDAEDAVQATFLVLARKARDIRQRGALAGWLYRVAYHLSVKLRAAARRRREWERKPTRARQEPADDRSAPEDLRIVLDEELDQLPEKYRAPLQLCCLTGYTREEAAERLGCTPGAVKMRLERGRHLLRSRLARRGVTVSTALLAAFLAQPASAGPVLTLTGIKASFLFAAGKAWAALCAQAFSLADWGSSAGPDKAMLLGAAAVLLNLVGLTVGLQVSSRGAASPGPATERSGGDGPFALLMRPGKRDTLSAGVRPSV
jgi:RNA polymerase sigma factor (sigma-70 family)